MIKCNDCLHYSVCPYKNNLDTTLATRCDNFTDISEWVHLPCKVGDNIYFPWIYGGTLGVAILEVYSIKMYVQGKPLVFIKDPESDMAIPNAFAVDDFGKAVFLTREEAEKALAQ